MTKTPTTWTRVQAPNGKTYLANLAETAEATDFAGQPYTYVVARRWIATRQEYAKGPTGRLNTEGLVILDAPEEKVSRSTAHDCTTRCSYPGPTCPGHDAPATLEDKPSRSTAHEHVDGTFQPGTFEACQDCNPAETREDRLDRVEAGLTGKAATRAARLRATEAVKDRKAAKATDAPTARKRTGVRVVRVETGWDVLVDGEATSTLDRKAKAYAAKRDVDTLRETHPDATLASIRKMVAIHR